MIRFSITTLALSFFFLNFLNGCDKKAVLAEENIKSNFSNDDVAIGKIRDHDELINYLESSPLAFQTFSILKRKFCFENHKFPVIEEKSRLSHSETLKLFNIFAYTRDTLTNVISEEKLLDHLKDNYYNQYIYFYENTRLADYVEINIYLEPDYFCEFSSNNSLKNQREYLGFIKDKNNYDLESAYNAIVKNDEQKGLPIINEQLLSGYKNGWYYDFKQKDLNTSPQEMAEGATPDP